MKLLRKWQAGRLVFWCPGCEDHHHINETWKITGTDSAPTVNPSILVRHPGDKSRCHLYIRDGQIQFLSDCTHAFAGKTVPMISPPPLPGEA